MTDTERIKMALPLLQALADGKQLQFRMPNDEWRAMELDCDAVLEQPTSYRIAPAIPPRPSVEAVLKLRTDDGRLVRLTGEYRNWKKGEQFINSKGVVEIAVIEGSNNFPRWIVETLPDHRTAIPDGYEIEAGPMTWREACQSHLGRSIICNDFNGDKWNVYHSLSGGGTIGPDDPTFILRPIAKPEPRYEPWDFQTVPMPLPVIFRRGTGYQIVAVYPAGFVTVGAQQLGWNINNHVWSDLQHCTQRDGTPCGRRVES